MGVKIIFSEQPVEGNEHTPSGTGQKPMKFTAKLLESDSLIGIEAESKNLAEGKNNTQETADTSEDTVCQSDISSDAEIILDFGTSVNRAEVIRKLILLANEYKCGKYTIRFDSDWYAIYHILKYLGQVKCNLKRFSEIIHYHVVPYIKDKNHGNRISCCYENLKTIRKDHPYRKFDCTRWKWQFRENPKILSYHRGAVFWERLKILFPRICNA